MIVQEKKTKIFMRKFHNFHKFLHLSQQILLITVFLLIFNNKNQEVPVKVISFHYPYNQIRIKVYFLRENNYKILKKN